MLTGLVVMRSLHGIGQILLGREMSRIVMRINIIRAMPQLGRAFVVRITQMQGNRTAVFTAHVGQCSIDAQIGRVTFRRRGHVGHSLR